jgi:serine/threonine-protein phosphatase PGAM5
MRYAFSLKAWAAISVLGAVVIIARQAPGAELHSHLIYLVRHGDYDTSINAVPEVGGPLSPLGIAEARLTAARLRGLPVHWDSLTSSTMERAQETAAIIRASLPGVPFSQSSDLVECTPPSVNASGGEKPGQQVECAKRLDRVFARRFRPAVAADRVDLIVAHGNVIRYLVTRALGVDTRAWVMFSLAHASLTIVRVQADGTMKVLAVGDVGHIPPNLQSWGTAGDPQLAVPKADP